MDRTQKRCLAGSLFLHGTLIVLLVAGAAFALKPEIPSIPFLEMVPSDLKVTEGNAVGGGSPNLQQPPKLAPAKPPQAVTPPARPVETRKDTEPAAEPKHAKRPELKSEPPENPEKSAKNEPKSDKAPNNATAQDVDPKRAAKKPIQIAEKSVRKTNGSEQDSRREREAQKRSERAAQEAREAQEAADRRNRAIEAANNARRDLAKALTTGAQTISTGVGSASVLEIPGPGGQAYAPYISYLGAFYRERWRKPRAVTRANPTVDATIEVAKDGTVLDWKLTGPSGLREMDDSVRELLRKYPKLLPLPDTTRDPKRIFTIQFRLEADTNL
jgi:outer membrane biosynthesis protein TonB